jgi:hypothetical protein
VRACARVCKNSTFADLTIFECWKCVPEESVVQILIDCFDVKL